MIRKLTKTALAAFALLVVVYISSPWWIGIIVTNQAPENFSISAFELKYPTVRSVSIKTLDLDSNELSLQVKNLQSGYSMNDVVIESVKISIIQNKDKAPKSIKQILQSIFEAPTDLLTGLSQIEFLERLKIATLEIESGSERTILRQVVLHKQVEQLTVRIGDLENEKLQRILAQEARSNIKDLSISIKNIKQKHELSIEALLENQIIGKVVFSEVSDKQRNGRKQLMQLSLESKAIVENLPKPFSSYFRFKSNETIFNLEKEVGSNKYLAKLSTEVEIEQSYLRSQLFSSPVLDSDSRDNDFVDVGIHWQANLIADNAEMLSGVINSSIKISESKLNVKSQAVLITREISAAIKVPFEISFKDTSKPTALMEGAVFNLTTEGLTLSQSNNAKNVQAINLTDVNLAAGLSIDRIDSNDLSRIKWKVVGELKAGMLELQELNGTDPGKKYQANSTTEMKFNLEKNDNILSSGSALFPEVKINIPEGNALADFKIDWKEVDSNLTKGNIVAEVSSKKHDFSGYSFEQLAAKAMLTLQGDNLIGNTQLFLNNESVAPTKFSYNRSSEALSLDLAQDELKLNIVNHLLKKVGKDNKLPLSILEGKLTHSAALLLRESLSLSSELSAENVLFSFGENKIHGLNIKQKIKSVEKNTFEVELSLQKIDFSSGLEVTDISAAIKGSQNDVKEINLEVNNLKGKLLDGDLFSKSLVIEQGQLLSSDIHLKELSLTELVFFLEVSGLYAEGLINLKLPTSTFDNQLVIKEGTFNSIGAGLIKYSTGVLEEGQEENIALQALRNFKYQSLDGTLSYNERGEYKIKLHLLGANPELYDGYPIDFVLNLSGELTGVFKSLFLTGNFEEAVMQQVKAEQQEKQ